MKAKARTYPTRNEIAEPVRDTLIVLLNQQLANTLDLYSQVKQCHWNVKGLHFIQLHLLFDSFADLLISVADLIAERTTALGGVALGTARLTASHSQFAEYPVGIVADKQVLEVLAQRYGAYNALLRNALKVATEDEDAVTADLFTEILRTTEKHLGMIESSLQE